MTTNGSFYRMPAHVREAIEKIVARAGTRSLVSTGYLVQEVRRRCPDATASDRDLTTAIAEEAVRTGHSVHFDGGRPSYGA